MEKVELGQVSVDHYQFSVGWSEEDKAYIARVAEFPSLAAHGDSVQEAVAEIIKVVRFVIGDLIENKEPVPLPLAEQEFSGRLNLRMPPYLHRKLVTEAKHQKISLNQLILLKLQKESV